MAIADRLTAWLPFLWFLLVVGVLAALWASGLASGLLQRIRKFGGFGVEFEFSEPSAKQTRDTIEKHLTLVRQTIQRELEADVRARGLQDGLKAVIEATALGTTGGFRAAVHIPDPLYENQLYQLLDYYPHGAGHGRTFSTRTGIIGLAWRTSEPQQWHQASAIGISDLVRQWGMTSREAARRQVMDKTKVMIAFPLYDTDNAQRVGVMYMDSDDEQKFGSDEAQRDQLIDAITVQYQTRLAKPLAALVESAKRRSPQLSLESQ